MQLFKFGADAAWPVSDFGSHFRLSRLLLAIGEEVRVDVAYLRAGDFIGSHPAGLPQLFCVVRGSGWASDSDGEISISGGDAVFWTSGEVHAVRTDEGLTAIIVQSVELAPSTFLKSAPCENG